MCMHGIQTIWIDVVQVVCVIVSYKYDQDPAQCHTTQIKLPREQAEHMELVLTMIYVC